MKVKRHVKKILGRTVFDSRGTPTTEVEIESTMGRVVSSCPSGASTGSQEALELRDSDESVCRGKGVFQALKSIEAIANGLIGTKLDITEQSKIDEFMCDLDGTENKSKLGANAILPMSVSFVRLGALGKNVPVWKYINQLRGGSGEVSLPKIFFNVINGGAHASNTLFVQEVMVSFKGATPFEVLCNASAYISYLKDEVKKKYKVTSVGDEGGFAPPVETLEEALDLVQSASSASGIGVEIAIDAAATEFYHNERYNVEWKNPKKEKNPLTSDELIEYYKTIIEKYKISLLEDPFAEKDYAAWAKFLPEASSKNMFVVGDDLIVTNPKLIKEAGEKKWCSAALIKMNQIGTVTETLAAVKEARDQGMKIMVSHRSGETEDVFLSHLAVGLEADYLKAGSLCRSERVCKYNELIRIFDHREE
ncbi:enolase [Nematocida sp. AWRm77]|nr:enolase [Nematocida sp. AWRm77]